MYNYSSYLLRELHISLIYEGDNETATAQLSSNTLTLTDSEAHTFSLISSSYNTISLLRAAINLLTGWTCELVGDDTKQSKYLLDFSEVSALTEINLYSNNSSIDFLTLSDYDKKQIVEQVEEQIHEITGLYFYPVSFSIELSGYGSNCLETNFTDNILALESIEIDGTEMDTDDFKTIGSKVYYTSGYSLDEFERYFLQIIFEYPVAIFPKGKKNILITGTKGYAINTVPLSIKRATEILVNCELNNSESAKYDRYNYNREKLSNYETQQYEDLTGCVQADRLIKKYIKRKIRL